MADQPDFDALFAAAATVQPRAYAPYSQFTVGAAILGRNGEIFTGVNVENASYGLTVCAERNAVGAMIDGGVHEIRAVAVCTGNGVTPCGACRQVLDEFRPVAHDLIVILDNGQEGEEIPLGALLPAAFGPRHLETGEGENDRAW